MSFLQPAALTFLVLMPVIVLFYLLRAQHNRLPVPTVRFWREIPSDLEGRPTWRTPLRNLLLYLQLLLILLVALALARPALLGGEKRHLVILLDASASMQATDVLPSRFEEAKRQAHLLIDGLAASDEASLIRVARTPVLLEAGDDRRELHSAIDAAEQSSSPGDIPSALALAQSLVERSRGARTEVILISDGAFPGHEVALVSSLAAQFRHIVVGQTDDNQAITGLSVRPSLGTVGRYVGFIRIVNYANRPVTVPFRALADGLPIDNRPLQLPARGHAELTLALPQGTKLLDVSLQTDDALRVDDHAQVLIGAERPRSVVVASAQPAFWEKALTAVPLVRVTKVRPSQYQPGPADLTVLDGFVPRDLPRGNLLLVNPSRDNQFVEVVGETGPVQAIRARSDHPLLDAADLTALYIAKTRQIRPPAWADVLLEASGTPLLFAGREQGRRVVVLAFDPVASELPQRIAFPILINNVMAWMAPEELATEVKPGEIVELVPAPEAREVTVRLPNNKALSVVARGRPIRFSATDLIGRYTVVHSGPAGVISQQTFVVNVTSEVESDIRPRDQNALVAGVAGERGATVQPGVQRELWTWLAALAFLVIAGEWWAYCRRYAT
ncbi:MAG: VWA domain-containing protein [Chloroflexi bacterium]|nr:VWA domain-containing protein [Chloroflexota bacterium]